MEADLSPLSARLSDLSPAALTVARLIAACRGPLRPADVRGVAAKLDGAGQLSDGEISEALSALAAGGLIDGALEGDAAQFAMSDAVREAVRVGLDDARLAALVRAAFDHFRAAGPVEGPEDLPRAIQLFHLMIEMGEVLAAARRFRLEIYEPLLFGQRDAGQCAALLERLLGDGRETLLVSEPRELSIALSELGLAYQVDGRPGLSLPPFERARTLDEAVGKPENLVVTLRNLSRGLIDCGRLRDAERALDEAMSLTADAGLTSQRRFLLIETWGARALRGRLDPELLQEASSLCEGDLYRRVEGIVRSAHARRKLWDARALYDEASGMPEGVWNRAERLEDARSRTVQAEKDLKEALERAPGESSADFLRARRLCGVAALLRGGPGDLEAAADDLTHVAGEAARIGEVVEEIPALLALAELDLRRGRQAAAANGLGEVRRRLAGSGYRLFKADFQILLCHREHAAGRLPAAVEAAARAYELAWCDGPPFVYHWGLTAARRKLSALGATAPGAADRELEIGGERRRV